MALVLAAPERRRMLRELLALSDWTPAQRARYAELIMQEHAHVAATYADNAVLAAEQERVFVFELGTLGASTAKALEKSRRATLRDIFGSPTTGGQRERRRRRRLRESVTAIDAREVVTLGGRVSNCLACGKQLSDWHEDGRPVREDRVYCPGGACKQRAARLRAKGRSA